MIQCSTIPQQPHPDLLSAAGQYRSPLQRGQLLQGTESGNHYFLTLCVLNSVELLGDALGEIRIWVVNQPLT